MVIVAGKGYLKDASKRNALIAAFTDGVRHARTEAGCLDFVIAADPIEADRVNVFERWASAAHLEVHLAMTAWPEEIMGDICSLEMQHFAVSIVGRAGDE